MDRRVSFGTILNYCFGVELQPRGLYFLDLFDPCAHPETMLQKELFQGEQTHYLLAPTDFVFSKFSRYVSVIFVSFLYVVVS